MQQNELIEMEWRNNVDNICVVRIYMEMLRCININKLKIESEQFKKFT